MSATWGSVVIPDKAWHDIKAACDSTTSLVGRIPYALAVSVAYNENPAFDEKLQSNVPNSKPGQSFNGREDSWGYYQLATFGVGHGYSRSQLQDGGLNALIALKEMVLRYTTAILNVTNPYTGHGEALRAAIEPWSVADTAYEMYKANPTVIDNGTARDTPGTGIIPGHPDIDITDPNQVSDFLGIAGALRSIGLGALRLSVGLTGIALITIGLVIMGKSAVKTPIVQAGKTIAKVVS